MRKLAYVFLAIFLPALIASCQTMAQRQATSILKNIQMANQNLRICEHKIDINPAYESIAMHRPFNGYPTLGQLADGGLPNDKDIRLLIALHNDHEPCRLQFIQDVMKTLPGFIPILVKSLHENGLITVDLVQRKITWGEANKRSLAAKDEFMAKQREFFSQLNRDLTASHEAELAQRQAALNALSQWTYQQQILRQRQEMIDSANQPTMMHCTMVPDGNGNLTGNCQ
jgi:hypothetical protein